MTETLSEKELDKVSKLMENSNTSNLAEHVEHANKLIIKALYHAEVDYSVTSKFIDDNFYFYAPLHIEYLESKDLVQDSDVNQWINTINNIVIPRAKKLF